MSSAERTPSETATNLISSYAEIEDLVSSFHDDEWVVPSLCPDWQVRDVLIHLLTVEKALLGWRPRSLDDPLPFESLHQLMVDAAAWNHDRLATELVDTLDGRRTELGQLDDAAWTVPCQTPVGPNDYRGFMEVRAFDFWVHARDIATPLQRELDHGGPVAEASLDMIEASIGYIVGKRIGLPDGLSIAFHLTGPVTRDIFVEVDGRARAVDRLADPTVEVTADSLTFSQLACGRIDPQGAIDDGRIRWEGAGPAAAEWGEKAARSLRFTM
jgi:uncharacterized protein (TIGR03083 family)